MNRKASVVCALAIVAAIAVSAPPASALESRESPLQETVISVNTTADGITGGCATQSQGCTLRDALAFASTVAPGYPDHATIYVPPGTYNLTAAAGGTLQLQGNITIAPSQAGAVIVDAGNAFGVMYAALDSTVVLQGLTLQHGAFQWGGGLLAEGAIAELDNCVVRFDSASDGGGIYQDRGVLRLVGTQVVNNTALNFGGGIWGSGVSFAIENGSKITSNTLTWPNGAGGGIAADGSYGRIANSTVTGNTATGYGGGIAVMDENTQLTVTGAKTKISGNNAGGGGGGIVGGGRVEILNGAAVTGNHAAYDGGGIYTSSEVNISSGASVTGNVSGAGYSGGGIYVEPTGSANLSDATVSNNSAGAGGGIYNDSGIVNVVETSVSGNIARDVSHVRAAGGGIWTSGGTALVSHSVFYQNRAGQALIHDQGVGGAIYLAEESGLTVIDSTITLNRADKGGNKSGLGGGIYAAGDALALNFDTIADNTAVGNASSGGNIYSASGAPTVSNSIVAFGSPGNCNTSLTLASGAVNDVWESSGSNTCGAIATTYADPKLDELNHNGGDTETIALMPTSPAYSLVTSGCISDDQRYQARAQDVCDAGAYEG